MIVRIVLMTFIFCSLLKADDAFAQTGKVSSSQKIVVKGEAGRKMDELLSRYAMYGFSGSVLVVKKNQVVINKAYGLADRESGRPNTVNSLYDVASIAKTFTSAAILQLEMQGKLKTDDSISKYLGEFPADKASITIHHLLTHTGGFKLDARDAGITPTSSPDEFLRKAKDAPLLSAPGEKYNYSNLGYGLLAVIVEKVSELNWQAYLKKNILKQARLSQTMLYGDAFPPEKFAKGYIGNSEEDLKLEEPLRLERADSYVWSKHPLGSVGVVSTTGDLYKWWLALHSKKVLSEEARRKMFSIQAGNQSYGWNIRSENNEITRVHRGGLRGSYQSMLAFFPKEDALLIFNLNKNNAEIGSLWAGVVWNNLENLILGRDYVVPPAIITSVAPAKFQAYAGEYELPTGERFVVLTENNRLLIGARGQSAVNCLLYPQAAPPDYQTEVSAAGKKVVELLAANDLPQIKTAGFVSDKDLPGLQAKWKDWMNAIGGLKSFQSLGVSLGSGGNPRTFIKLSGEKSSLVVRLLWFWGQKRLAAWGDDIPFPASFKLLPESETSFINFDFDRRQTFRLQFNAVSDGKVNGLTVRFAGGKTDVFARRTNELQIAGESVVPVNSEAKPGKQLH